MYQLYTIPGSCSTGIHTLLNELAIPVEIIHRDDVENYSAIAPTNQVPALKNQEQLLTEGAAIALYLLNQYGQKELVNDQHFIRWLMFNYATLHPAYSKLFTVNASMEDSEAKQKLLQALGDKVAELLRLVDQHLYGRQYMYGEKPTLLDYLIAIYVRWGSVFSTIHIPVGDNILALINRVTQLSQFKIAFEKEGISY